MCEDVSRHVQICGALGELFAAALALPADFLLTTIRLAVRRSLRLGNTVVREVATSMSCHRVNPVSVVPSPRGLVIAALSRSARRVDWQVIQ